MEPSHFFIPVDRPWALERNAPLPGAALPSESDDDYRCGSPPEVPLVSQLRPDAYGLAARSFAIVLSGSLLLLPVSVAAGEVIRTIRIVAVAGEDEFFGAPVIGGDGGVAFDGSAGDTSQELTQSVFYVSPGGSRSRASRYLQSLATPSHSSAI
jgi:hypothetical protein